MELPNRDKIKTLGGNETCEYLSILEVETIKQAEMKDKIISEENEKTARHKTL